MLNMHRSLLSWGILALVICGVVVTAAMLFGKYQDSTKDLPFRFDSEKKTQILAEREYREAWSAVSDVSQGKYEEALSRARDVIQTTAPGETAHHIARSAYETALYYGASSSVQERVNSIRLTKEHYLLPNTSPLTKVLLTNKLLGFVSTTREPEPFEELFRGVPFSHLAVPGDMMGSILNLAKHALLIHRHSNILFWIAAVEHAGPILDPSSRATEEEKRSHAQEILEFIRQADELYPGELQVMQKRPYFEVFPVGFFRWKVFLYGAVAEVYPEYLAQTEVAFQEARRIYQKTLDNDGNQFPIIELRLPRIYIGYAMTIHAVGGPSRDFEARAYLKEVIRMVGEHPEIHRTAFGLYVEEIRHQPGYDQYRLQELAKISPEFRDFLEEYGWKILSS